MIFGICFALYLIKLSAVMTLILFFLVISDDADETEATAVQEDEMTDPGKIFRWAGINHFFKSSIFQ